MFHSYDIKVRFYELDPYNHLNHAAYVQYFEVARIELLESIGYGMPAMAEAGFHIVVTGIRTRFLASARAGETVTIDTEMGEIKRVTTTWHQRMRRGDEVLATQTVEAAITKTNGRPTRIPEGFATAAAAYAGNELI
ncbi:MAG: acyl-CoA thioesterase [bacterium]|nr:acyl-CoA thioesterase [bacterium]